MTYGPTSTAPSPTASVLAYNGKGEPRLWWNSGLRVNPAGMPRIPKILVDLETPEGLTASVLFPTGKKRVLVDDPGRELVIEHFGLAYGSQLGETLAVHLITEQRSDGTVVVEVIPSSGPCDPKVPFSWRGGLRVRKVRVRIATPGWDSTPIDMGPAGDGYLGIGNSFAVRFVCFLKGNATAKLEADRLARYADLTLPDPFPGLGPGEHVLPRTTLGRQDGLQAAPQYGPLHFDTKTKNGYEGAGNGVFPIHGWENSEASARTFAEDVTRILSRAQFARVHRDTGEPIFPHEWPKVGRYVLDDGRWSVDPWNWGSVQGGVVAMYGWSRGSNPQVRDINPGPSAARGEVLGYEGHNAAHLVRVRRLVPAWYQTRRWAARLGIRWNGVDVATSWDLQELTAKATNAHGQGGEYLREFAWINGSVADWLSITPPGDERDFVMAWRAQALKYRSRITLVNGFPRDGRVTVDQQGNIGGSDNGVPWQEGLPLECGAAAWFQLGLDGSGLFDLWTAGGGATPDVDHPRLEWLMGEGLRQGIENPLMPLQQRNPPNYPGVSFNGIPQNPIRHRTNGGSYGMPGQPWGHAIHDYTHLALLARVTGNKTASQAMAMKIGPAYANFAGLFASWRAQPNGWNVIAAAYLKP